MSLDLDDASRSALEFDELLAWVASFARSPVGARRIAEIVVGADEAVVRGRLAAVAETRHHLRERGPLLPERVPDPAGPLRTLAVAGVRLDGRAIRDLALALDAATAIGPRLRALPRESFPRLRELADGVPDLAPEAERVLRGTDGEGRLLDDASPELGRLRRRLAQVAEGLRRSLERYLREPGFESAIRDDFVTQRNERFVIPVRTDAPRPIRGIVHASSSSGVTRFVEPFETVEANNERVRLIAEEQAEQERILAAWSDGFRRRAADVAVAIDALARADGWQARARFADSCDGVIPSVSRGGPLHLDRVRHPLLHRRLVAAGGACVPATLRLDPADRVLVLSGPNTGGKTVALKAVGLAVLMAQSGIPVPAASAELPLFVQVRADIGDHQSIQADLSTYSAHVRAIAGALSSRRSPALLLFDEIGTGTEPTEGGALALAILESLIASGVTVVATTHLAPVKAWAVTTEGASCAALEFDTQTLRPTYRIVMGAAGRSAGLEIAERLGIAATLVDRARELVDPRLRESEEALGRLREALGEAERQVERARSERRALEQERLRWEVQRDREAARRGQEADRALERALEAFRKEARREVAALGVPAERARAEQRRARAERRMVAERSRQRREVGPSPEPAGQAGAPVAAEGLHVGRRVWVPSFGRTGEIQEVDGREAQVRLGALVVRLPVDGLREPPAGEPGRAASTPGPPAGSVAGPQGRDCPRELMLIGRRVEEALAALDRFLDSAALAGHEEVRIVHGHGSGRLRTAVRSHLAEQPQVAGLRPGSEGEGGDGATVVTLH